MSVLSQLFGSQTGKVKTIQRGTISITINGGNGAQNTGTLATTVADITKCEVFVIGITYSVSTGSTPSAAPASAIDLTNTTTVTGSVYGAALSSITSGSALLKYQVIEYY